jgi:hypothetical protein
LLFVVWVFFNIAGIVLVIFVGISPAPGFIRTFSLVTEQVGWRREKRIGAVYDYLDLIVGGRFVSWDSILFLMMD